MRIALVDDDPQQLHSLQSMLRSALQALGIDAFHMDSYPSAESFLSAWQPGCYDIILLDIYMKELSGVDAARQLRLQDPNAALAFCTSSNEFAAESYEVGAAYYLHKPITEEKISTMLKRLDLARIQRSRTIRLPDGFRCLLRQIQYTEYSNHSVTFHIQDAQPHSVYMNHAQAENLLLHYPNFCCINKGCIVNFAMVKRLANSEFLMEDGLLLPISRRRYKDVYAAYTQYHFTRLDEEVSI